MSRICNRNKINKTSAMFETDAVVHKQLLKQEKEAKETFTL